MSTFKDDGSIAPSGASVALPEVKEAEIKTTKARGRPKKPRKPKDTAPKPKRERKPRAKLSPEVKAAHAREAARRYYLKNKENIAARTKASYAIYYQNNREAVLAKGARRRDRIKTEKIKKLYKGLVARGVAPAVVELREPKAPPPSPTIEPQQVE